MTVRTDNLDLANRRIRLGLSQQEVADRMGKFNHSIISRFERGERDWLPPRMRGEPRQGRKEYIAALEELAREAVSA